MQQIHILREANQRALFQIDFGDSGGIDFGDTPAAEGTDAAAGGIDWGALGEEGGSAGEIDWGIGEVSNTLSFLFLYYLLTNLPYLYYFLCLDYNGFFSCHMSYVVTVILFLN